MKSSVKVSLIAAVIATIGIGGLAKLVSASPQGSLIAVAQQKIESLDPEAAKLQALAKISASDARQTAEAAQENKASSVKLENEDGNLLYAVIIGTKEVKVDAGNGQIIYTDDNTEEGAEAEAARPRSSIQIAESERGETKDDEREH